MKRLELIMLSAIIGTGLLVIGCGGSGDSGTASTAQPAATAPAQAPAPAAAEEPAAAPETAAAAEAGEPSEAKEGAEAETAEQAERPRFVPPVRGTANIEVLPPSPRMEGNEVVTRLRIRNASLGAIAMLRVDETWYDKAGNALPGDSQRHRALFMPGEVIEIVLRVPRNPAFYQQNFQFSHANGKIEVKTVKSFPKTEGGGS